MKLDKLVVDNFCSHEHTEVDFNILPTIIPVIGKTGSGKSSLFVDAILFALYGVTRITDRRGNGIEHSINDLSKPCEVSLSFYINNKLYEIDRKRGKIGDNNIHNMDLSVDGHNLDGYILEKQNVINEAIKLSYQSFLDIVMLQQDKGNDFIIKDSSSDIFEDILFLKTINNIKKIFNDRKKDLTKEKDNLKLYKYYDIGSVTLEELEASYKDHKKQLNEEILMLKSEEEKYYNLNFSNKTIIEEKNKIKQNNYQIKKRINELISECKERVREANRIYEDKIDRIKKIKGSCPACLRILEEEDVQNLIKFYLQRKIEDAHNIKANIRENIRNIRKNIQVDNIDNLDEIIKNISISSNKIKVHKKQIETFDGMVKSVNDKIERIKDNKNINIKINNLQSEIDKCEKIYDFFGDKNIPSILAQKIFPVLENKINNYLARFSSNMITKFMINKKGKRSIQIFKNGKYRPFGSFSGGEEVCINMAARISSADIISEMLGASIGTLILDEPFPSLDDGVTESFIDVVEQISKKYNNIIIITHVDSMKSMFGKHIEVLNQNGKSFIRS